MDSIKRLQTVIRARGFLIRPTTEEYLGIWSAVGRAYLDRHFERKIGLIES